jgi:exodeoxyribonuclease VII large subunit
MTCNSSVHNHLGACTMEPSSSASPPLNVSELLAAIRAHVASTETLTVRGEVIEVSTSDAGQWITLAEAQGNRTANIELFLHKGLIEAPRAPIPGSLIEAQVRPRIKERSGRVYLAATSSLETVSNVGPIADGHRRALERLIGDGLLSPNRLTRFDYTSPETGDVPTVAKVVVLTKESAKGFGDFRTKVAAHLDCITVRRIRLEGPGLVDDLTRELASIDSNNADLVLILRGGGDWAGLQTFDDERVARAIAKCRVPVATAVGHHGDVTLADRVARWAFINPTDAGQALRLAMASNGVEATADRRRQGHKGGDVRPPSNFASQQRAEIERLKRQLTEERERGRVLVRDGANASRAARLNERSYAQLWRFTDQVLLDSGLARVRVRSRWQAATGTATSYLSLALVGAGGLLAIVGLGMSLTAACFAVYVWRGPHRARHPATSRAMRTAPANAAEWVDRIRVARTPRALRILVSSRPMR